MNEIEDSTTRVSTLVGAAKQYSQLDRAPYQVVDVHELLDSTLLMLAGKIGDGVTVVKDYDRSLPPIPAYAGRAQPGLDEPDRQRRAGDGRDGHADHPHGAGRRLRAGRDRRHRARHPRRTSRNRIFEPFFTTKPVGEGTGLGLDISWRIVVNKHHGDLRVESVPGDTRFQVRLPITARRPTPRRPEHRAPDMTAQQPQGELMTRSGRRPGGAAERHRLRRVRGGVRLVAAPAPVRRSAGTSAAATTRPPSTPPGTPRRPATR